MNVCTKFKVRSFTSRLVCSSDNVGHNHHVGLISTGMQQRVANSDDGSWYDMGHGSEVKWVNETRWIT